MTKYEKFLALERQSKTLEPAPMPAYGTENNKPQINQLYDDIQMLLNERNHYLKGLQDLKQAIGTGKAADYYTMQKMQNLKEMINRAIDYKA